MTRVLLAIGVVLVTATGAAAQTSRDELTSALTELQRAVDALGPRRPPELAEAVQWLRGRLATTDPAQVSPEYLRTFTNAAALLNGSPSSHLVDDITQELQAKVDHCRTRRIGMGASVLLRVNTRRG
jgi:hypothetical protein